MGEQVARWRGAAFDGRLERRGTPGAGLGALVLPLMDMVAALAAPALAAWALTPDAAMLHGWLLRAGYGVATGLGLLLAGQYRFAEVRAPLTHVPGLVRAVAMAHGGVWLGLNFWGVGAARALLAPGWGMVHALSAFALILTARVLVSFWWRHDPAAAPGAAAVLVSSAPCPAGALARLDELTGRRLAYGLVGGAASYAGLRLLPDIAALEGLIRAKRVDEVVFFAAREDAAGQAYHDALLARLAEQPILLRFAVDTLHRADDALVTGAGLHLVTALERPLPMQAAAIKRTMDVLLGGLALLVLAPVMAVIALLLCGSGPVLFRQRRVGANGVMFDVLKFRTMSHGARSKIVRQAQAGDQRVTRLGRWLRRSSLDELPQLFNVLRGDMALVGPRPHAPGTAVGDFTFEQATRLYGARHRIKPGMTGLAQVRGLRGPTRTRADVAARVAADLDYIARWSPWLDVMILLRTLPAVIGGRNAC
ncbi:MAG: sugar transferase [Acidiphilium sp.]